MEIKKILGRILKCVLSDRLYRLVANGFIIIPAYYKEIINDTERYHTYALQDSAERDLLMMRKYGHILDKGLHRRDATPGHSKIYYSLLKECIQRLSTTKYSQDPTIEWAKSKVSLYEKLQSSPSTFCPLENKEVKDSIVSYEQFLELAKTRRSNRFFKTDLITEDIASKLVVVSNWASSSCNKQPIQLFYTLDPTLASKCLKCCKGGTGFSDFIPSFWVFAADSRGYVWPSEYALPYVDVSLGTQNVMLAAQTLGITGTILSWAQKDATEDIELRRLLSIPQEYVITFCVVMGYAKYNYLPPIRKI